jgi:site-specific recombinase XerD
MLQFMQQAVVGGLPGSAALTLAANVVPLDPELAVFEGMLAGWERQQRSRVLQEDTISGRVGLVRRLSKFSDLYPWQWSAAEVEAFFDGLRSGPRPITASTARNYQVAIRLFLDFVTDARYGWGQQCQERFGRAPLQVLDEWNSRAHVADFEGAPGRRPLTYDEVQALFDAADGRAEQIRARGRKGVLPALRDAAMLKTVYAFGLRRREAWGLDVADMRHNPKVAGFGRFGAVFVRWGKASRGSPPKRRTVLTVPEMDWIVPVLQQWVDELRPRFSPGSLPSLWVTERCSRLGRRGIDEAFTTARTAAGLDPALDLHALRHSYVTHLIEFGYPEKFVQDQCGHLTASTTAIYSGVSDEYRNRLLTRALQAQHPELWGQANAALVPRQGARAVAEPDDGAVDGAVDGLRGRQTS